jgi:hypothetical protein
LTEAPSATGELGYTAYQYLTITGTNIAAEKITDTRIEFKVDKSWLESNQVDRENIALYRYTLDEWVEQATRVKSEDTGYVYYEATTLGLSYFAIGERPEKEVVVEETTPIDEGKPEEVVKEKVVAPVVEKAPESVIEEKPSFEWSWLVLVVGIAIVVAGLAFGVYEVVMHRKTQESGASAKKTEAKKTENKKT